MTRKFLHYAAVAAAVFIPLGAPPTRAATTPPPAAQLLNISTRGYVQTDDRVLIGGFIVTGAVSKRVLLRGLGPSLTDAGLSDTLADPVLELRDANGNLIVANDDWRDEHPDEIEQTDLAPEHGSEAAIVAELFAPDRYTVILRGSNNGSGIGLIEAYDLTHNSGSLLANVSTRGFAEAGDRAMIGGFIVGGGDTPTQVIARGIGPSLEDAGVPDPLQNPTLELRSAGGAIVATNNDWKQTQQSVIEETGVAPSDDLESALVAELSSGAYTAILRGHDGAVGTALVELYDLGGSSTPAAAFSFENGLQDWTPNATDVSEPPIFWAVTRSQDRATRGSSSLKFEVDNMTDAAKVWVERAFPVRPNTEYRVNVQFSFATADYGDLNHWTIIAGVRTQPAETRDDLTYQGTTANGEPTNTGYKWLEKTYDFEVVSGADGILYVDLGVWGTWEAFRVYYIDDVQITITEQ